MLFKKMLRDMIKNWPQFLSILILAFLSVFVYASIESLWYGIQKETDDYYKESNMADLWIYANNITKGDVNTLLSFGGIKETERRLSFTSTVDLPNDPSLEINVIEKNEISKCVITDGSYFSYYYSNNGILLNKSFADARGIKPGDEITLNVFNTDWKVKVSALMYNPEYIVYTGDITRTIPDHMQVGFAFVSEDTFKNKFPSPAYTCLVAKLDENVNLPNLKQRIEDYFGNRFITILDRDSQTSTKSVEDRIVSFKTFALVFPVVFFLLALLTMLTTMVRLVESQRTQIGILKALGYSSFQILWHYISYGIWIGLFGGIIGLIIAPNLIPQLVYKIQEKMFIYPSLSGHLNFNSYFSVLLIVICCVTASIMACFSELVHLPAIIMRPKAPKMGKRTFLENIAYIWNRMSFSLKWTARDMGRNKARSIMAILGVMGCMALQLNGLGLLDSVNNFAPMISEDVFKFQEKIVFKSDVTNNQINEVRSMIKADSQLVEERGIELSFNGKTKKYALIISERGDLWIQKDLNKNIVTLPDEGILITHKSAQVLGVNVNDIVQYRLPGDTKWKNFRVVGIISSPMPQGVYIYEGFWKKLGNEFNPTSLMTSEPMEANKSIKDLDYVSRVFDLSSQLVDINNLMRSLKTVVLIFTISAITLGTVVLYNLGLLNFTERVREFATLKVLGFYQAEIVSLVLKENVFFTIFGWIIGIPAGVFLVNFCIMSVAPENLEIHSFIRDSSFIISSLATICTSILVNFILSNKIRKLDMVESLKSIE